MLKAGHEQAFEAYNRLKREYNKLETEYRSETTLRQSMQLQSAKQAMRLGEAIADLVAREDALRAMTEERDMWRSEYWRLATAGSEPMPTLRLVAPEGA